MKIPTPTIHWISEHRVTGNPIDIGNYFSSEGRFTITPVLDNDGKHTLYELDDRDLDVVEVYKSPKRCKRVASKRLKEEIALWFKEVT